MTVLGRLAAERLELRGSQPSLQTGGPLAPVIASAYVKGESGWRMAAGTQMLPGAKATGLGEGRGAWNKPSVCS